MTVREMNDEEKALALEESVINDQPEVTARLYKRLGKVPFTARALGYACRFRGLEMVKVLVEGGANFYYDINEPLLDQDLNTCRHWLWKHSDDFPALLFVLIYANTTEHNLWDIEFTRKKGDKLDFLPIEERVRIAEYLCDHAGETGFEPGDLLFYSICNNDLDKFYFALKNKGITLSEEKKKYIKSGKVVYDLYMRGDGGIKRSLTALLAELDGEKPRLDNMTWDYIGKGIKDPGRFRFVFENFNLEEVKKLKIVEKIIELNDTVLLENVLKQGWLKNSQKRDEMIEFSVQNGKTECTAILLDYKNRCFDLAAEREKAEQKLERELNAAPDSARVLCEFWRFKKRPDGTYYIKAYLGIETAVTVPEKIDNIPVTAIANHAFSPDVLIKYKQREKRKELTEVIIPGSITEIGEFAFWGCKALKKLVIPRSVNKIAAGDDYRPFAWCENLVVALYKGSYAEQFCKENNIPFEYI